MESRFAAIAARAIADAEATQAPFDAFVEGLREMQEEISGRYWLALDEQRVLQAIANEPLPVLDGEIIH